MHAQQTSSRTMLNIPPLRPITEPLLRRVLHFYWRLARGMTLGVRALVINAAGEIFLIKHSYVEGWHLPGGGVETGETLREALARELAEEGNITLPSGPALFGVYFNASASPRDHVALYVVRHFEQLAPPKPDREIIAHGFFHPTALPADTTPATRRRIRELLEGGALAERW
jgi:ADP-ribose pyrophosphatase YjhB (NUDIX family)